LNPLGTTGDTLDAACYNAGQRARTAIARALASLGYGEGLYRGGALDETELETSGTEYPASTILVEDDSGQVFAFDETTATAITFTDEDGALALYAVVELQSGVSPAGATGDVVLEAQLAASAAPLHSLKLGTGDATAAAFTSFAETAGVRVNKLRIGAGDDADLYLYANNGDANLPGIRYQASGNVWQLSNDGTTWISIPTVGGVSSVFGRTGAVVAAASDYDASEVDNDSSVSGAKVSDALNTLLAADAAGGMPVLDHVGAPLIAGYSVGDRIRDSLGAVFQCMGITGDGAWVQETPGVIYLGSSGLPTDADVVSGGYWLGDIHSRAYRVRLEPSYVYRRYWAQELTLIRNASGTDYVWVESVPQRLALTPLGTVDFTGAVAQAYLLLHQPPGTAYASHLGFDGMFVETLAAGCASCVGDGTNHLQVALYEGTASPSLMGVVAFNSTGNLVTGLADVYQSADGDDLGRLVEYDGSTCPVIFAAIEEVAGGGSITGLALYADVRWYHTETYGGYGY